MGSSRRDGQAISSAGVSQHKNKTFAGFTAKYDVDQLVWFETHPTREAAFKRERQIKKWNRVWKLELIEKANPGWDDLHDRLRVVSQDVV